ncbi:MAG: CHASE domain-containing protein [Planctomycetes bacterium]|nr:CHASE domain-containing protein [Planctomycetota bacterium]
MSPSLHEPAGARRPLLLAAAFFLLGTLATFVSWAMLLRAARADDMTRLDREAEERRDHLMARMEIYENSLSGAQGLFAASKSVEREEWHEYVGRLRLQERYPGVQAMGFAPRVTADRLPAVISAVRAEGFPEYTLRPAGVRAEYFPIVYIEPFDGENIRAFGVDAGHDATRQAALNRARDTGAASLTAPLTLAQYPEGGSQSGAVLHLPVYANGQPTGTVEERRAAFLGVVFCAFRMGDLVSAAFAEREPGVAIALFDGLEMTDATLFSDPDFQSSMKGRPLAIRRFECAGRPWTLAVAPRPTFPSGTLARDATYVLVGGTLVALLLAVIVWSLAGTRLRALLLAEELSADARKSESAAQDALQRFQTLARLAPLPIFATDAQGLCTFVNEAWCRMAGMTPEEARGPGWSKALHPDDAERVQREWYESALAGREFTCDHRFRAPDGRVSFLSSRATPLHDPEGRVIGHLGSMSDLTEHREKEIQLHEKAEELSRVNADLKRRDEEIRLMFEKTSDAVIGMDGHGVIRAWNPRSAEMFGWSEAEAIGRRVADLIMPERFRESHTRSIAEFVRTGEGSVVNRPIEMPGLARDGREIPVELVIVPAKRGDAWSFTGFARDISVRKAADQEMLQAREAALASNRAKSEFLANVSHEIRTPMNGILGMTELTLGTELTAEQREYLVTVKRSAQGLLSILNGILDFSKIEAGKLELDRVPFNIRSVVQDAVKLQTFRAREKGIRLGYSLSPDVPERLTGDPLRLGQVLNNLIANAVKFTSRGEVEVTVALEPSSDGSVVVRCSVRDTGIGIPKDKQSAIFEAFTQADASTTRRYGGTGLGLAISTQLVALMGGRLWLESEPGKGSTFHFTSKYSFARSIVDDVARAHAVEGGAARRLRILLAEDNAINQRLATVILARRGHLVTAVTDGHAALEAIRAEVPDVVLMDVQMPDMDGVAATLAIRRGEAGERARQVPIVAMTAHSMAGDRERFLQAGMTLYISKPVDARDLVEAVEAASAGGGSSSHAFAAAEALERVGGDPEVLLELAVTYVHDYERMTSAIRMAVAENNFAGLERAAHSIRGAAGIFSAIPATLAAQAVEEAARAKDPSAIDAVPALETELKRLRDELQKHIQQERV